MLMVQNAPVPLVILFAGSGPNDHQWECDDRNDSTNSLPRSAKKSIATYRYDKRSFTLVGRAQTTSSISDDFVTDAKKTCATNDPRFNKIILAGHSQDAYFTLIYLR
jgi:hypothetical protein